MRAIEFRGKSLKDDRWVFGSLIQKYGKTVICYETSVKTMCGRKKIWCEEDVDPVTVGQFIGFTDKTGNRIFEGDVVSGKELYMVIFKSVSFQYMPITERQYKQYTISPVGCECEIISNIHDNPELIKN